MEVLKILTTYNERLKRLCNIKSSSLWDSLYHHLLFIYDLNIGRYVNEHAINSMLLIQHSKYNLLKPFDINQSLKSHLFKVNKINMPYFNDNLELLDDRIYYSRPFIVKDILTVTWEGQTLISFNGLKVARHAPHTIIYNNKKYHLLTETEDKSFYWPIDEIKPIWLINWLSNKNIKAPLDLGTLFKRTGMPYQFNIEYDPDKTFEVNYGVLVVKDIDEIIDGAQITILFELGTYFKGTIISKEKSGLPEGFYGGLKHPNDIIKRTKQKAIAGNILSIYHLVPWTSHLSLQTVQYCNIKPQYKINLPSIDEQIKASTGLEYYVRQYNSQLIKDWVGKIPIKGVAGQVCPTNKYSNKYDIIVEGKNIQECEKKCAILWSPILPINTQIPLVNVLFKYNDKHDYIIFINTNSKFLDIFINIMGRDFDGDGIVITDEPWIVKQATPINDLKHVNVNDFKIDENEHFENYEEAMHIAVGRLRYYSNRMGIYDLLARRICVQLGKIPSENLAKKLTEAIQVSISSKKKNIQSPLLANIKWVEEDLQVILNNQSEQFDWLYKNELDYYRLIPEQCKIINRENFSKESISRLFSILDKIKNPAPKKMYNLIFKYLIYPIKHTISLQKQAEKLLFKSNLDYDTLKIINTTIQEIMSIYFDNIVSKIDNIKFLIIKELLNNFRIYHDEHTYRALLAFMALKCPESITLSVLTFEELINLGLLVTLYIPTRRKPTYPTIHPSEFLKLKPLFASKLISSLTTNINILSTIEIPNSNMFINQIQLTEEMKYAIQNLS